MPLLQILRPTLPILIGASLMLTLSMGLRQSLGIFLQPLTRDIGISVSDFMLAIAAQTSPGDFCSRSRARSRCATAFVPSWGGARCFTSRA